MKIAMTPLQFAQKQIQLKKEQSFDLSGESGEVEHGDLYVNYAYDGKVLRVLVTGGNFVERSLAAVKIQAWLTAGLDGVSTTASACIAVLLLVSMVLTGCTQQQQADFKVVVAKVAQYEPEVTSAVDTLAATLDTFMPQDALLISATQATFDAAAAELQVLCQAYAATPNTGTLASIRATIEQLLTTNAGQFLAAARISNPVSMAEAKVALGGIRTILLLMDAAFQTAQTPAQTAAIVQARSLHLADVKPYLDRHRVEVATGHSFDQVYAYERSLGA